MKGIVAVDEREFAEEQRTCPRKPRTSRGDHFWDTHPTNQLLHEDVKSGKAGQMLPHVLHETKQEYQDFSAKVFGKHVHQEKGGQGAKPYWVPKRNEEGMKKHKEEVDARKEEFESRYLYEEIDEMTKKFAGI